MEKTFFPEEIQQIFDDVVVQIKKILDPDYIMVAGSFGKGAWLYSDEELLSDFEFVFICKKRWSPIKKKELRKRLNQKYKFDISLKGFLLGKIQNKVISNYSNKYHGYLSLIFFDTFKKPQILYSKYGKPLDLPVFLAREVPPWEAWRLLVNRLADILNLSMQDNIDKNINNYYWLKVFESIADAFLLVKGKYSPDILSRVNTFTKALVEEDEGLSKGCVDSYPYIHEALLARQQHSLSFFNSFNEISMEKSKYGIVSCWLSYFQEKMFKDERINSEYLNSYDDYLKNKNVQKKYLETSGRGSIIISNLLRIIQSNLSVCHEFRIFNFSMSWKHVVLLAIASVYDEYVNNNIGFSRSKKILENVATDNRILLLQGDDFIKKVIYYWKYMG